MSGAGLNLLLIALPVAFTMFVVLNFGGILGWVERKQSAIMQDRIGANRASIFGIRVLGLLHPLADAIKLLTKEVFMPARADRLMFTLAPFVSVFFGLAAFASIPFGDTLRVVGREIPLQAVTLNVGVLYVFAMLSLGVYGVIVGVSVGASAVAPSTVAVGVGTPGISPSSTGDLWRTDQLEPLSTFSLERPTTSYHVLPGLSGTTRLAASTSPNMSPLLRRTHVRRYAWPSRNSHAGPVAHNCTSVLKCPVKPPLSKSSGMLKSTT